MNTNNNGGFPPIQYIEVNKSENKDIDLKKERFFATIPKKNLDIKNILSISVKNKMIDMNVNKINIIESL